MTSSLPEPRSVDLKQLKYLLFDVDGTLADTIRLILDTFHETLRILEMPPLSDEEILSQIGRPLHLQMRDLDSMRDGELIALYSRLYRENHDRLAKGIPGIKEALAVLAERGYRMAVVTSKRSMSTHRDLRFFALDTFFEVVVAADDTSHHKPHPEPVLSALELMGAPPDQATYIGDSPYDLRSAHAAGVLAGAVEWSPFPREALQAESPDYWVPSPQSLTDLFPGPQ
jgi:pyrophosphatase PpaX